MQNIFKILFFDALYDGSIANGFRFLVTLHDSKSPFRGTMPKACKRLIKLHEIKRYMSKLYIYWYFIFVLTYFCSTADFVFWKKALCDVNGFSKL